MVVPLFLINADKERALLKYSQGKMGSYQNIFWIYTKDTESIQGNDKSLYF